jgi:hypothetical protein
MDLICTRCGEPWDLYHVLHENPAGFDREGGLIRRCPTCPAEEPKLDPHTRAKLAAVRAMAQLMGDDVDGLAAAIADSELV